MLPLLGLSPVSSGSPIATFDRVLLSPDGGVPMLHEVEQRLLLSPISNSNLVFVKETIATPNLLGATLFSSLTVVG
ncbi:MAG: hypothetical protein ACREDM_06885 [Methylocella sp.]